MFLFKSFYSFMYPVLVVWGLGCCAGCSPAVASGGGRAAALQLWRVVVGGRLLSSCGAGPLVPLASPVAAPGLRQVWRMGSEVAAPRP